MPSITECDAQSLMPWCRAHNLQELTSHVYSTGRLYSWPYLIPCCISCKKNCCSQSMNSLAYGKYCWGEKNKVFCHCESWNMFFNIGFEILTWPLAPPGPLFLLSFVLNHVSNTSGHCFIDVFHGMNHRWSENSVITSGATCLGINQKV